MLTSSILGCSCSNGVPEEVCWYPNAHRRPIILHHLPTTTHELTSPRVVLCDHSSKPFAPNHIWFSKRNAFWTINAQKMLFSDIYLPVFPPIVVQNGNPCLGKIVFTAKNNESLLKLRICSTSVLYQEILEHLLQGHSIRTWKCLFFHVTLPSRNLYDGFQEVNLHQVCIQPQVSVYFMFKANILDWCCLTVDLSLPRLPRSAVLSESILDMTPIACGCLCAWARLTYSSGQTHMRLVMCSIKLSAWFSVA